MPEPTRLQRALADACEFAIAHGVEACLEPKDFGIQRDASGRVHATYIDNDCALRVILTPDGAVSFAVIRAARTKLTEVTE